MQLRYTLCAQVWIDTTGQVGPYMLLRLAGARVVAYVHYPTISSDMLARVSRRQPAFNNSSDVASSAFKSWIKLVYYRVFAQLYGILGGASDVVLVNSNWTRAHVESIWWGCKPRYRGGSRRAGKERREPRHEAPFTSNVTVVFPPCDVSVFAALTLQRGSALCVQGRPEVVLCSVGQFRPEKNHACASHYCSAVCMHA